MKEQVASEVCRITEEIFVHIQTLLDYAQANCEGADLHRIVDAATRSISELDFGLLVHIHKQYPELKPQFLP